jgi:septal ring factor EnvC (AmiA/AmiB activator)
MRAGKWENFLGDQLPGGRYHSGTASPATMEKLRQCPTSSDRVETTFGVYSSMMNKRAPNTSIYNLGAVTAWKLHHTTAAVALLPEGALEVLVKMCFSMVQTDYKDFQDRKKEYDKAAARRREEQREEEAAKKVRKHAHQLRIMRKDGNKFCATVKVLEEQYKGLKDDKNRRAFVNMQCKLLNTMEVPAAFKVAQTEKGKDVHLSILRGNVVASIQALEEGKFTLQEDVAVPPLPTKRADMTVRAWEYRQATQKRREEGLERANQQVQQEEEEETRERDKKERRRIEAQERKSTAAEARKAKTRAAKEEKKRAKAAAAEAKKEKTKADREAKKKEKELKAAEKMRERN